MGMPKKAAVVRINIHGIFAGSSVEKKKIRLAFRVNGFHPFLSALSVNIWAAVRARARADFPRYTVSLSLSQYLVNPNVRAFYFASRESFNSPVSRRIYT